MILDLRVHRFEMGWYYMILGSTNFLRKCFLSEQRDRDSTVDPSHLELEELNDGQSQPRRPCRMYSQSTESTQNTNDVMRMIVMLQPRSSYPERWLVMSPLVD